MCPIGPIQVLIEEATKRSPELRKEMKGMTAEESVAYLSKRLQDSVRTIQRFREMGDALKVANQALERQQDGKGDSHQIWRK